MESTKCHNLVIREHHIRILPHKADLVTIANMLNRVFKDVERLSMLDCHWRLHIAVYPHGLDGEESSHQVMDIIFNRFYGEMTYQGICNGRRVK